MQRVKMEVTPSSLRTPNFSLQRRLCGENARCRSPIDHDRRHVDHHLEGCLAIKSRRPLRSLPSIEMKTIKSPESIHVCHPQ